METLRAGTRQGENGAAKPWWNGTRLQAEIPAGLPPAEKYRSEVFWQYPDGQRVQLYEGDHISCEFALTPHLGDTAADGDQWQVVWQLHGPTTKGDWPPPPLTLHVRSDTWRIGGGAGREEGGRSTYAEPFPAFVDGREARWRIDAVVSSDPQKARVDAWLDGKQVVTDWHPPAGTRYPDHDYLTLKSGLYAGTDGGGEPPSERRYTTQDPLRCSLTTAQGTPRTPSASPSPGNTSG